MDSSIEDDFLLDDFGIKKRDYSALSEEEKERILFLKEVEKLLPKDIAIDINRSITCVNRFLSKKGLSNRRKKSFEEPINQENYEKVMELKKQALNSKEISVLLGLSLSEINLCWSTLSYNNYLDKR